MCVAAYRLARDFEACFALCPACATDTPLTPDERQLLISYDDDLEPETHALRLSLTLAWRACADLPSPWSVPEQLSLYLSKVDREVWGFERDATLWLFWALVTALALLRPFLSPHSVPPVCTHPSYPSCQIHHIPASCQLYATQSPPPHTHTVPAHRP